MQYNISVIVPIYKVEQYIEKCVRSLLEQTLEGIQYIFVDDKSPDKSLSILEDVLSQYPKKKERCVILHHEQNRGLATARNTGLSIATGEYIFHCDSDDFLETDALSVLYQKAKEEDVDIVWSDWFLLSSGGERYMKEPDLSSASDALQVILSGGMKFNVWNKLVKRSLYQEHKITFPDGHNMGEDLTMVMLFAKAEKVAYLPQAFYHYVRLNANAYTQQESPRQIADIRYNSDRIIAFLKAQSSDRVSERLINYFKLNAKYPFLISNRKESYRRWKEWYPEADKYILSNPGMGVRAKILQLAARFNLFFILSLHYRLLQRYYQ